MTRRHSHHGDLRLHQRNQPGVPSWPATGNGSEFFGFLPRKNGSFLKWGYLQIIYLYHGGNPKSSISMGFSIMNHPILGNYPHDYGNPQMRKQRKAGKKKTRKWKQESKLWLMIGHLLVQDEIIPETAEINMPPAPRWLWRTAFGTSGWRRAPGDHPTTRWCSFLWRLRGNSHAMLYSYTQNDSPKKAPPRMMDCSWKTLCENFRWQMSSKNFTNSTAQQLGNATEKESVTSWFLHSIACDVGSFNQCQSAARLREWRRSFTSYIAMAARGIDKDMVRPSYAGMELPVF